MAVNEGVIEEAYYEHEAEASEDHFTDQQDLIRRTPWWIISVIFHTAFLVMAAMWTISGNVTRDEFSIFEMNLKKLKTPEYDPTLKREVVRNLKEVNREVIVENPVITKEDLKIDELETPDDMEREHKAKGRQEAVSTIELEGDGWVGVFGVGGGGSGAYGWRDGGGKRRAIGRFGGNQATESAVLAALMWLARHQEADGHWDSRKWGAVGSKGVGWGDACFDESVTGLALLAFLGAGHTSRAGKFRNNVKRAVDWIISKQRPEGNYSTGKTQEYQEYDSAICTLALVEEYGMTRNPLVRDAAEKGVYYIINKQKPSGGWAHTPWDSTSVLGWMVMALKSAKMARINVPQDTFDNAIKRLDSISDMDDNGYPGLVGYSKKAEIIANRGLTMTAVGMLAYQFLGAGDKTDRQAEMIIKHPPVWEPGNSAGSIPQNFYHWYYATLGIFQYGGGHWKIWNKGLQDALLPNQRQGGPMDGSVNDVDGSWDPVTRYDNVGGRAYSTAMGALCLEVYYRYRCIGTHRSGH